MARQRCSQDHARHHQAVARREGATGKLRGRAALIMGGERGIGLAVALAFAREGADIALLYLNDHRAAEKARQAILRTRVRCVLVAGDAAREEFCDNAVKRAVAAFGRLDILVNNVAEQPAVRETLPQPGEQGLRTNLLGMFYLSKAAMPHLPAGGAIINTAAVTAFRGGAPAIQDAPTAGAIVSFTRSLARALSRQRIRVNAVAPTAILAAAGSLQERAAATEAIAARYVALATPRSAFVTGRVLNASGIATAA